MREKKKWMQVRVSPERHAALQAELDGPDQDGYSMADVVEEALCIRDAIIGQLASLPMSVAHRLVDRVLERLEHNIVLGEDIEQLRLPSVP